MKATIINFMNMLVWGDIKRHPHFDEDFSSPTCDFIYTNNPTGASIQMKMDAGLTITMWWTRRRSGWYLEFISNELGTLKYNNKYYYFSDDLKRIVDYLCETAEQEYNQDQLRKSLAHARREMLIFRKVESKIKSSKKEQDTCLEEQHT